MTEPHIEKAAETVLCEFARWNRAVEPREAELVSRAALDAAFAELAANPPEEMVEAFNRGWMDGFKNYAVAPGADEAHVETLRRRGALSAAFGALREKNDE